MRAALSVSPSTPPFASRGFTLAAYMPTTTCHITTSNINMHLNDKEMVTKMYMGMFDSSEKFTNYFSTGKLDDVSKNVNIFNVLKVFFCKLF